MNTIHVKFVNDEHKHPVAVQIDYADWLKIKEKLSIVDERKQVDLSRFAGTVKLSEDPLEFQRRIRDEWS